ncbi:MAG: 23S rRNA (adenine(2503)-C(2))-methyltransferase RlmN [Candidatus Omnitrophica bacterium]|jgi:23S rRNA (adenine2503-C2)-methyltransferase|nr:23S rRNA (adenine(2503)-C(2))-methyltransferase RlmN [Candidatus Omnitrophota bacterium]
MICDHLRFKAIIMTEDVKNYTLSELKSALSEKGVVSYCACQIFNWIYAKRIENFDLMTDVSKETKSLLLENFYFSKLKILKRETSLDKTEKFLFELNDGASIESVFIPEGNRFTLCLSSQVGCKYSCKFCLSGSRGLKRNLTAGEIVNQYLAVSDLSNNPITNMVFMGIGEPLDNFEMIVKAIRIFTEHKGLDFGKRRISISTCGIIPQIQQLSKLKLGVKLSVSLHSADCEIRSKIMPVNRKYPLGELMKALKSFSESEKYPVTFEYALFGSLNTSKLDAQKLIRLLRGMNCKINLIPYNASQGAFRQPTLSEVEDFCNELEKAGLFYTLRKSRGQDIRASCGQLYALWG